VGVGGGPEDERLLQTFLELVRIDSPSRYESGCADYCARALTDAGCEVRFDDSAAVTGSDTGNLIARLPGTAPGKLLLSAHLDTVEPGRGVEPVIADGIVFSERETVLGADDKAGIAAAIECVRRLAASPDPRPEVTCVFTVQEEVGLLGAKALHADEIAGDLCLVLDADGAVGGIVIGAPTHYTFSAVFTGRAAHAGVAPEMGVSAIAMAADAITAMTIGRLDERTTANVGTVSGGSATNVIAARAELTGECRSLERERVEGVRQAMEAAMRGAADARGGFVDVVWKLEYEGFSLAEDSDVVQTVERACSALGLTPRTIRTGGGSDANVFAATGTPTVALSCGMQGVHGTSEQIAVSDLEALAALCVEVAKQMVPDGDRS
jgi:tripeptide aminopeptidase